MQIPTKWLFWNLLYVKQTNKKKAVCEAEGEETNYASQMFLLEDSFFSVCCYAEIDDLTHT